MYFIFTISKLISIVGFILIATSFVVSNMSAQSSEEIGEQIKQKQSELETTNSELAEIRARLEETEQTIQNTQSGIPLLEAELANLEAQIDYNRISLIQLQQELELNLLEKEIKEQRRDGILEESYQKWKINRSPFSTFTGEDANKYKMDIYTSYILGGESDSVKDLNEVIKDLNSEVSNYQAIVTALEEENLALESRRNNLEYQLTILRNTFGEGQIAIENLLETRQNLETTISALRVEQQAAAAKEQEILRQQQNFAPRRLGEYNGEPGDFYFSGYGRDLYQGHGVGFSQWGAYGGGYAGMSAEELLAFYYPGTSIGQASGNITIMDLGLTLEVEDYLKHLGEVPHRACGSQEQVNSNPNKYALDNPNSAWDCWPEETIKAQIIAARSYALYHGSVFSDARSQVYNPAFDLRWAVEETRGQTLFYNGQIIEALYSADNNQGQGTANSDTVFQNFEGEGSPRAYLVAVNDSPFAYRTSWGQWTYATLDYKYEDLESMLKFIAIDPSSGYGETIRQIILGYSNDLGSIVNIEFERDPSMRVKKVWLVGSTGERRPIGGWWFKNMWNIWASNVGTEDYIYSLSFYMTKQ